MASASKRAFPHARSATCPPFASYSWYDAGGAQLLEVVPDAGFQNLIVDHWYRWSTTFDLDTNRILRVSLTDLTSNVTAKYSPTNRYLAGGAAGLPPPTAFRVFVGASGTVAGNTMGFDNVSVAALDLAPVPMPALSWLGLGIAILSLAGAGVSP